MFKKRMGMLTQRAGNQAVARVIRSVREARRPSRGVSKICHAISKAKEKGKDVAKAIKQVVQWPAFAPEAGQSTRLITPDDVDGKIEMLQRYPMVWKLAPQLFSTSVFRDHVVAANLLRALSVIAGLYRTGKRAISGNTPISFAPKGWMPLALQNGGIDRRAYEFRLFAELKRRFDAGDVRVQGARRFQSFESFLIPTPIFKMMRTEDPLPVAVDTDVGIRLSRQRRILDDVEPTGAEFSVMSHKLTGDLDARHVPGPRPDSTASPPASTAPFTSSPSKRTMPIPGASVT